MYAVTGASGQLGRLVIDALLSKIEPQEIVALVRDPSKVADLAGRGVIVRAFDYDAPATLPAGLEGVDRLLLISSSEVGRREPQHQAVIAAVKAASVSFIAYTSLLHADRSPLGLAVEHRQTEAAIEESGLPYSLLRNGWYLENYTVSSAAEIDHGTVIGSSGDGRISAAGRGDYAAAAAAVLLDADPKQIYELAGDEAFTLADYAAALAKASGKAVSYVDLPEEKFRSALEDIGLPGPVANILADSSAHAAGGALFDDGQVLSSLIGRPTTSLASAIVDALG